MAQKIIIGIIALVILLGLSVYVEQIPFSLISETGLKEGFPASFKINGKSGNEFNIPYEYKKVMFNLEIINPGENDLLCIHQERNFADIKLFQDGRRITEGNTTAFNRVISRYTLHRWDIEEDIYQVNVDKKLTSGRIYCKVGTQSLQLNLLPPSFWQLPNIFQRLRGG